MILNEKSISDNIKRYRKLSGLTQKQLASMIGSHANYISELERWKQLPSIEVLYKIADALKISPDLLIYENLKCHKKENFDELTAQLNKNINGLSDSKLQFVLDIINSFKK